MIRIEILLFVAVLQVSLGLSLRVQRDLNTTDKVTFAEDGNKDGPNSSVSQSLTFSRKPAQNTTETETYPNGIDALVSLLNSTLFEFNSEISRAIQNASASGHNPEESAQLSRLVQNVQTFLKNQSASLPTRNVSGELGLSLKNFKTVLADSEEKLNSRLIRLNHGNFTLTTKADAGNATNGHREGKGLIDSFMQISSQVGQGLKANIRDAEDVVQSTVQQVQSQVQSFVSGVNSFVNDASSALSLPNIFNFSMPNIFEK